MTLLAPRPKRLSKEERARQLERRLHDEIDKIVAVVRLEGREHLSKEEEEAYLIIARQLEAIERAWPRPPRKANGVTFRANDFVRIRAMVEALHERFKAAPHPDTLWAAYRMCRTFLRTEPFPEWILAGFDEIGDRLSRVTAASSLGPKYMLSRYAPPNGHWTKNATYVLFGRAAGRDLLRVHAKWDFDYFLAIRMRLKLDAPSPNNESDAIYLVAKEWEVSESKVRRAWKRFQAAARAEDYELQADFAEHLDRPLFEARDRLRRDGINPTPIQEWLYGTYDGAAPSPAQRKSRKTKLVSFQSRNRRK